MRADSLQRIFSVSPLSSSARREQAAAGIHTGVASIGTVEEWAQQAHTSRAWSYRACAGRLVELSGSRAAPLLTLACALVLDAQRAGEPVAWIQRGSSTFFPPDAARNGVDLAALVVLRIPEVLPSALAQYEASRPAVLLTRLSTREALDGTPSDLTAPIAATPDRETRRLSFQSVHAPARAAGRLLRSGAFGLIVLDLEGERAIPAALLGKLGQLAQRHDTAVCCLTLKRPDRPSLGSFVSLRGEALRRRTGVDRFSCVMRVLKDKRSGPGWTHEEVAHGAPGLS